MSPRSQDLHTALSTSANSENPERVRSALSHLSPETRAVWVRQAMAIKSQFGEDGLVAGEMSSQLDIPPTNLSFHLKTLTHAGLVYVEQEGRFQRYRANASALMSLVGYLMEKCCDKQTKPKIELC